MFTLHNRTNDLQEYTLATEPSEAFMFSGPKQVLCEKKRHPHVSCKCSGSYKVVPAGELHSWPHFLPSDLWLSTPAQVKLFMFEHCDYHIPIKVESECCRRGGTRGTRGSGKITSDPLDGAAEAKEGEGGGVAHGGVDCDQGYRGA